MTTKQNSRAIKFRIWDKEYKQWRELPDLYGDYQASAFRTYGNGFEIRHFLSGEAQEKVLSGEIVIQQFTGLIDKNGREIYEGDIFKSGRYKWDAVEFKDAKFVVNLRGARAYDLCELFDDDGKPEIVGNIFENPDLCYKN